MRKLQRGGVEELGVASLICAGFMLLGNVLPLSAQVLNQTAVSTKGSILANGAASLGDLAGQFLDAQSSFQFITPPMSDFILRQDGGVVVFDPKAFPDSFNKSLIGMMEYGCPVYSVTGVEDPTSRTVIFLNADGAKIASVAEAAGDDPWWMLKLYHPDLYTGHYTKQEIKQFMADFDPSRIRITWKLLPKDYADTYSKALAAEQARLAAEQAAADLMSPKSKLSGGMMMYQGTGMTNFFLDITQSTGGIKVTLAYPDGYSNKVDFFTCPNLIAGWWDLAVSKTNVSISTNFIEWVDVNSSAHSLRFYQAGNAEQDTDLDGIPDAREVLMYHTCPTNTDTDGDGLSDSNEVFCLNTDPNNPKTNKPNVYISYPASESRKVWLP